MPFMSTGRIPKQSWNNIMRALQIGKVREFQWGIHLSKLPCRDSSSSFGQQGV